jgi:ligand-binding sensor domain-containing protein/serine phosphatase RsbU (regulator of sigma subunit)/ABC-type amino acid transport substrate-binding protein
MSTSFLKRLLFGSLLLVFILHSEARSLQEIKRSGKLLVAFTEWDYRNINYPLALEFARYLNVKLVDVNINWDEAFSRDGKIPPHIETDPELKYTPDALRKADIICSTFSTVEWRKKLYDFAETLYSSELLLTSSKNSLPHDYTGLKGKTIAYMAGTTFDAHMQEINKEIGGGIILKPVKSEEDSKKLLIENKVFGIVLDADEALNFNTQNNNAFQIVFPVSPITRSAWAVEKNNSLRLEVEDFFETISGNGVLDKIFYDKFQVKYSNFIDRIRKTSRLQTYHRDLDGILASKKLVVALRERDFIYKEGEHKQFMHALAEEFADFLGVKLEFIITPNSAKYWENSRGKIVKDSTYNPEWFNNFDLACEIFAPASWRSNKVDLVSIFPTEYVVVAKKKLTLNSMDDLSRFEGVTAKGTVYEDMLQKKGIKAFHYTDVDHFLEEVSTGKADYAIVMNAFFELSSYPDIEPKFSMGETEICWALRKDQPLLEQKLQQFIKSSRTNGLIRVLDKALRGKEQYSTEDLLSSYYESFQTGQLPYILYGTADGLPQEDVLSILQDSRGYMWFGTNAGAARYNGREMHVIDSKKGLAGNTVFGIAEDSAGLIYLASSRGVAEVKDDSVIRNLFPNESFCSVIIDPSHNKWLLSDHGPFLLRPDGKPIALASHYPELKTKVSDLSWSANGKDWFLATEKGIVHFSSIGSPISYVTNDACIGICTDANDSVWISSKKGLYIIASSDLKKNLFAKTARRLNKPLGIPDLLVKHITTSRFGNVWLVSDYRLFQVISTDQKAMVFEKEIGLKNNTILSFFEDGENNLWIGFSGGLQRITNRSGLRNFFPTTLNSFVHSLFEDKQGRIWISSNTGIYYHHSTLVDATPLLGLKKETCLGGILPDGNLVIVANKKLIMVNADDLRIIREYQFSQALSGIEKLFISSRGELFILTGTKGKIYYLRHPGAKPICFENRATMNVYSLLEVNGDIIGGNSSGLISFNGLEFRQTNELGCAVWSLCYDDGVVWLGTDCGLKTLVNGDIRSINFTTRNNVIVKSIVPARNKTYLWLGTNNGFFYFNKTANSEEFSIDSKDGLLGDEITVDGLFVDKNGVLWIGTYHGISNFNVRAAATRNYSPVCYIERIVLNGKELKSGSRSVFKRDENNLLFEISALSFADEQSIEYEFYLRGMENDYSSYSKGREYKANYPNLPAGKYEFIYKAKGKNGLWGYAQKYEFRIQKAWYETWIFRFGIAVLIVSLAWLFYRWRLARLERLNIGLNQLVSDHAKSLEESQLEIEAQRARTSLQSDQINFQQNEITGSINYAEQVQKSILHSGYDLLNQIPDHFILFKPCKIVSGDFYWAGKNNGSLFVTAADCSVHGIPGAFMSLLGISFLNELMNRKNYNSASRVLDELRALMILEMKRNGQAIDYKDGMNMAVCRIDLLKMTLDFSGANRPLYFIRNGELKELEADKMSLTPQEEMSPFTNQQLQLLRGDLLYLFSDGYADQPGGPEGKKFMSGALKNFLLEIQHLPMRQQRDMLDDRFMKWKASQDQEDDVVMIGIRI